MGSHLLHASNAAGGAARACLGFRPAAWSPAHAAFYGDETASETMGLPSTNQSKFTEEIIIHLHILFFFSNNGGKSGCRFSTVHYLYWFNCISGGACGYGNLFTSGHGTDTAAPSSALFKNGYVCGTCFQIRCMGWPLQISRSKDSNNGGWCNPPRTHFDMAKPAFMKIANWKAGIVPVMYRQYVAWFSTWDYLIELDSYCISSNFV